MIDLPSKDAVSPTWLTRIAINSALMILRKKRISAEISIDSSDDPVGNLQTWELKSPGEDPESRYIRRERQKLFRQAIHQLPAIFRDVVRNWGTPRECSGQEIAKSLGISVPAVLVEKDGARKKSAAHVTSSNGFAICILMAALGSLTPMGHQWSGAMPPASFQQCSQYCLGIAEAYRFITHNQIHNQSY